jgi:hypothetical protein
MVVRGDVSFIYSLSPRIMIVDAPSVNISVQDVVDTARDSEDEEINLEDPVLISAAGKEDLGGSVSVGITATYQDAVLAFEARKAWTVAGTVTTSDATGRNLIDSGATFITDGIEPGAWIVNFSDFSICTALRIISETEIRTDILGGGTLDQFTSGNDYRIMNVTQCEIDGGNLVSVDKTGVTISSILPTAGTQIVRTSASSATSRNSLDVEYASFNGGITVDVENITGLASSGTTFPAGTIRQPCDNFTDAIAIASTRGFDTIFIRGNATIDSGLDYTGITFIGASAAKSNVTIDSAADVIRCEFEQMTVDGTLDGYSTIRHCEVGDLAFFNGFIEDSGLVGTVTLAGGRQAHIINCHSGIAGGGIDDTPTIDCGGSGQSLVVRNYSGGLKLTNRTGIDAMSLDFSSGQVIIDSTVTNGEITIRGIGRLTDNSTGNAVINAIDLIEGIKIQRLAYDGAVHIDTVFGTPGVMVGTNGLTTNPVDTLDDAITIINEIGFRKINLVTGTLALNQNLLRYEIKGSGRGLVDTDGYSVDSSKVEGIGLTGILGSVVPGQGGNITFEKVYMADLYGVKGTGRNCIIAGNVQVNSNESMLFINLSTEERDPANNTLTNDIPRLDVNGSEVVIQSLDGYMVLENVNTADSNAIISMNSAHVYIAPSCTNGNIIIRGSGEVTDASSGTTINTVGNVSSNAISTDTFNKLFPFVAGTQ